MAPISPERHLRLAEDTFGAEALEHPTRQQHSTDSSPFRAPSSIEAESISSRTFSDLSESCGSRPRREPSVPLNIYPSSPQTAASSLESQWRQAYVLSSAPPEIDCLLAKLPKSRWSKHREKRIQPKENSRCPLIVLLMDPPRKQYELMQLWIDVSADTVRDVLQSVRQQLPDAWNTDYDGLIEQRGGQSTLLINCVGIRQFDVVPHEVWIAKPCKMSKDRTVQDADDVLDHLKDIRMMQMNSHGPATLSRTAQARIHAPEGILTHHHARQYLTFVPPFESLPTPTCAVASTKGDTTDSDSAVSALALSYTSLGLVKSYDNSASTEQSQEVVVLAKKTPTQPKTDVDCGETASTTTTAQNSVSPLLLRQSTSERSDSVKIPPSAPMLDTGNRRRSAGRSGVGKLRSVFSFRKTRKNGFLNLDWDDSGETMNLTDDDAVTSRPFPIEVDKDER